MPQLVLLCAAMVVVGGAASCGSRPSPAVASLAPPSATAPVSEPDSLLLTAAGLVGAGGQEPLLARTAGRVRRLYFTGGEYVHRGDVLAKLYNYNFVIALRDGFLGPCYIRGGQYLTASTQVTTLSRRRTLVVVCLPNAAPSVRVRAGDSVLVWVASRPTRVASGIVETPDSATPPGACTVLLPAGAPFRLGERACVRRRPRLVTAAAAIHPVRLPVR